MQKKNQNKLLSAQEEAELEACKALLDRLSKSPELCSAPQSPYEQVAQKASLLMRRLKAARKKENRQRDQELSEQTQIRQLRTEKEHGTYLSQAEEQTKNALGITKTLAQTKKCYICKQGYQTLDDFYDSLCPQCAEFNQQKRTQTADLSDRTALVTGGRIKIGFQIALKLLRAGANVLVTSRFPMDTAKRYSRESDFNDWSRRLRIYSADFRFLPAVVEMAEQVKQENNELNILINNAAQTVRRPPEYFEHLLNAERELSSTLPKPALNSIRSFSGQPLLNQKTETNTSVSVQDSPKNESLHIAAMMSQLRLIESDGQHGRELFPTGQLDFDGQQIDKRPVNSWVMELSDVSFAELLEVHAVNSLASYSLIKHLQLLLLASKKPDRYIVNVSAVEGQFDVASKTGFHPHTNMAKAGMNMVTKTCGDRFAEQGIYMTSVDTGWVTNEFPFDKTRMMRESGFEPPLDEIDGAARVLDPVFVGVGEQNFFSGVFLKDYQVANW